MILTAVFSPDANPVVFGVDQGITLVSSVYTGEQDGEALEGHTKYFSCLSFSPEGRYPASRADDAAITIWNMSRKEMKTRPLRKHIRKVIEVKFSPNRNNVVSCSEGGYIIFVTHSREEEGGCARLNVRIRYVQLHTRTPNPQFSREDTSG